MKFRNFLANSGSRSARFGQVFEPFDLCGFAGHGIGRGKGVGGFELSHGLGVFEPLAQRVDEDRIQPVDAVAVLFQQFCGGAGVVGSRQS